MCVKMGVESVKISPNLQAALVSVQQALMDSIVEHHKVYQKIQENCSNTENTNKLHEIQKRIHSLGDAQKKLFNCIRSEIETHGQTLQRNGVQQAFTERASALNQALAATATALPTTTSAAVATTTTSAVDSSPTTNGTTTSVITTTARVRKQNIVTRNTTVVVTPPTSPSPPATAAAEVEVPSVTALVPPWATDPLKLTQHQFLAFVGLISHEAAEILKVDRQKDAEKRKRRSTTNPQFFYGNKSWDLSKRKRGGYLISSHSPPNTRASAKKAKTERAPTPPSKDTSRASSPTESVPKLYLPNLPNGLIIEPVNPNRASPDSKLCIMCRQGSGDNGSLSVCELCRNGFHITCHHRPLKDTPRKCPKCSANQDVRTVCGGLTVPMGMTVVFSSDVSEKLQEKQKLVEAHKDLVEELGKLQEQHDHLAILLKDQKVTQDKLVDTQHSTQAKIDEIVAFVEKFKSPTPGKSMPQQELLVKAATIVTS